MPAGKTFKVFIFGDIAVGYGAKRLNGENFRSDKAWQLFEYLVLHRDRSVPRLELQNALWLPDEVSDPANSLKVLIYKLRSCIETLGCGSGKTIIVNDRDAYSFNTDIQHIIDVEAFEDACNRIVPGSDDELAHLLSAIELLDDSCPSSAEPRPWAKEARAYYDELYKKKVLRAVELMRKAGDQEAVVELSRRASRLKPAEEAYRYCAIHALADMGRYHDADIEYMNAKLEVEKTSRNRPDRKLNDVYRSAIRHRLDDTEPLDSTIADLTERINYIGSYRCDYTEFRDIYRVSARRQSRMKGRTFICQLTLVSDKYDLMLETDERDFHIKLIEEGLAFMLRQGDVFTRSASMQYLLLLYDVSKRDAESVTERLLSYFREKRSDEGYDANLDMRQVVPSQYSPLE